MILVFSGVTRNKLGFKDEVGVKSASDPGSFSLPVSFLLLLPGMNQYGIITKYTSMAKREINKLLKQKEKKNE